MRSCCITLGAQPGSLRWSRGWESGGRLKKEVIHVYLWLICIAEWQKPSQYCKAVSLQLKNKLKKKNHRNRNKKCYNPETNKKKNKKKTKETKLPAHEGGMTILWWCRLMSILGYSRRVVIFLTFPRWQSIYFVPSNVCC